MLIFNQFFEISEKIDNFVYFISTGSHNYQKSSYLGQEGQLYDKQ